MTAPRCRWFWFSLRTLFVVVTLLLGWVGWQMHIVRERRAAMGQIQSHDFGALIFTGNGITREDEQLIEVLKIKCPFRVPPETPDRPSYIRELLGDVSVLAIGLKSRKDLEHIRSVFPEASILVPTPANSPAAQADRP